MRVLLFAFAALLAGCAHAKEYTWATYDIVGKDGPVSGPMYSAEKSSELPFYRVRGSCEYVWGPYAVRVVNEDTGEERTFICDDVLKQKAAQ